MKKQGLEILLERASTWPEEAQEELVRSAFDIEMRHFRGYELTEDDHAALARSLDDVRNGRFATEREVAAVFSRYRHA